MSSKTTKPRPKAAMATAVVAQPPVPRMEAPKSRAAPGAASAPAPVPITMPHLEYDSGSRTVKGEDTLTVKSFEETVLKYPGMMYMVCDGHMGDEASNFVSLHLLRVLASKLPPNPPEFGNEKAVTTYAEAVQRALAETFVKLDNEWAKMGLFAGTTVTCLLVVGQLLTIANIGDSEAWMDTGSTPVCLIHSHRLQENKAERERLKAANVEIAQLGFHLQGPARGSEIGVGPVRLWPGGLCVSRSVGDLDSGAEVLPLPHIKQMMLPAEGARIIISSDGLWDVVQNIKAVRMVRSKTCKQAVQTLLNAVARDRRLMDDTSVIVVDIMPSADVSFPVMATGRSTPEPSASGGGGLFACFGGGGGAAEPQPVADVSSRGGSAGASMHGGTVKFICDIDTLAAFPQLRGECQRGKGLTRRTPVPTKGPLDFTMHGEPDQHDI